MYTNTSLETHQPLVVALVLKVSVSTRPFPLTVFLSRSDITRNCTGSISIVYGDGLRSDQKREKTAPRTPDHSSPVSSCSSLSTPSSNLSRRLSISAAGTMTRIRILARSMGSVESDWSILMHSDTFGIEGSCKCASYGGRRRRRRPAPHLAFRSLVCTHGVACF